MHSENIAAGAADIKSFPPSQPIEHDRSSGRRAADFLLDLVGEGLLAVALIVPDGAIRGRTFTLPDELVTLSDWIDERDGEANLYFTLNEPRPGCSGQAGKLRKQDVARIRALAVDLDPVEKEEVSPGGYARERARLLAIANEWKANIFAPPSAIVDSGNGLQMIWVLKEPLLATDAARSAAEAHARGLERLLGSDAVHNLDRLFRIPFTTNLPNAKKRAKGRGQTQARLISACRDRYRLEDLALFAPPSFASDAEALAHLDFDYNAIISAAEGDDIGPELRAHADNIRDRRKGRTLLEKTDRSERDFGLVCACVEHGVTDPTDVGQIVFSLAPDRLLEDEAKGKGQNYAARTINRGMQHALAATPAGAFEKLPEEPTPLAAPQAEAVAPPSATAEDWPEPFDLFEDQIEAGFDNFPVSSLPDSLARWVESQARRTGASTTIAASSALAVASSAIGASIKIQPQMRNARWQEPASLWFVVVADPGSRKSPVMDAALQPLADLQKFERPQDERRRDEWLRATKRAERKNTAGGLGPQPPVRRRLLDSATMESAIRVFRDNPRGVMRYTDEWTSMLGELGAYKRTGGGDRATLLRLFEGRSISSDRVGSGNITADCALQAVLAGTQPDLLRGLMADTASDGLAQRTIFVLTDGHGRAGIDEAPDEDAEFVYDFAISRLAKAEHPEGACIRLTDEGYAALREAEGLISILGRYPGSPKVLQGHLEKWGKLLPRLILTLHCFGETAERGVVDPGKLVPLATVERAIGIAKFLLRHQVAVYERFAKPDDTASEARNIANYLLTKPDLTHLTHKTIYDTRRGLEGSDVRMRRERARIMDQLVDIGWCRVRKFSEGIADSWSVNPLIHVRFAKRAETERAIREARRREIVEAGNARREWLSRDKLS